MERLVKGTLTHGEYYDRGYSGYSHLAPLGRRAEGKAVVGLEGFHAQAARRRLALRSAQKRGRLGVLGTSTRHSEYSEYSGPLPGTLSTHIGALRVLALS